MTLYTPKIQNYALILGCLCHYTHSNNLLDCVFLFVHTILSLYLGLKRLKHLEEEEFRVFENSHMLQSVRLPHFNQSFQSKNLIEQIFTTVPDGIGVIDFSGTSFSNKIFTELIGDPAQPENVMILKNSNDVQFFKNLRQFIRESQSNQGTQFTLFEDLKVYHKNILSQNRHNSLASESREYYTIQETKKNKSPNDKSQARKYYMLFSMNFY